MDEAQFNTIVKNSCICGFKISDRSGAGFAGKTIKSPFDGFGIIKIEDDLKNLYWESKFNNKLEAINLKRIEPHQYEYLTSFNVTSSSFSAFILGMHVARGDLRAYIFDWKCIKPLYEKQYSIKAKQLLDFPYNSVSKGIFTFDNIITSVEEI